MTGWGQEGPLAQTAGHDINYIAVTGALHAIGSAGGPPQIPVNFLGDFGGGGTYLVIGVLAALQEAARSGCGQVVDAAITDGAAHLLAAIHGVRATGTWEDERGVNILDGGAPLLRRIWHSGRPICCRWRTGEPVSRLWWRVSASTSTIVNRTTARHGHECVRSSRPRSRNILRLTGRKCSGAPTPASLQWRA
jgi:CoA-transferase family III